jgi:hypothetical protein
MQSECRKQKFVAVHVIMLQAFSGPRPHGQHGCHIDDNKDRNILDNLEWATKSKNLQSRFINHGGEKLDKQDISKIRSLSNRMTQTAIAEHFGVTQGMISRIANQKAWHYV